jgi:large subunit ribosomal protein L46
MFKNKNQYRPVAAMILSDNFSDGEKFLIVKKPRKNHAWQFPQGGVDEGESFLAAAERELLEECGKFLRMVFLYSWPVGEYQYDFPVDFQRHNGKYKGAIVQFFRGILEGGAVEIDNKEIVDYKWVRKDEFAEYFDPEYLRVVNDFL